MSQQGAVDLAAKGYEYRQILAAYYLALCCGLELKMEIVVQTNIVRLEAFSVIGCPKL